MAAPAELIAPSLITIRFSMPVIIIPLLSSGADFYFLYISIKKIKYIKKKNINNKAC